MECPHGFLVRFGTHKVRFRVYAGYEGNVLGREADSVYRDELITKARVSLPSRAAMQDSELR